MKTAYWLIVLAATGAAGLYVGFDYGVKTGAETMSFLSAQAEVSEGISLVRASIDALGQSDLEHANGIHEKNLRLALSRIDTYSSNKSDLPCYRVDRETMEAARKFVGDHPALLKAPEQQRGLQFCVQHTGGA